jgi:hypothetical protein
MTWCRLHCSLLLCRQLHLPSNSSSMFSSMDRHALPQHLSAMVLPRQQHPLHPPLRQLPLQQQRQPQLPMVARSLLLMSLPPT